MKRLIILLALSLFSGMWVVGQSNLGQTNTASGLSTAQLLQVRERLPCLKPGLTMPEVFEVLGVDVHEKAYAISGSGPTDDYRVVYQLAPVANEHGYNLVITQDENRKFKRAEIACWTPANQCAADNEQAKDRPKDCPEARR